MQDRTKSIVAQRFSKISIKCMLILIAVYQTILSPLKLFITGSPTSCRFHPSCSEYARFCFLSHGLIKGLYLTLCRLLKCHPFQSGGYDPPPVRKR